MGISEARDGGRQGGQATEKKGITTDLSFLSSWRHRHTFNTTTLISVALYSLPFYGPLLHKT